MNEEILRKRQEYLEHAQSRIDEISGLTLDKANSLMYWLVKAYRAGAERSQLDSVFPALHQLIDDAKSTYEAAIAQPEPKISTKRRVELA